MAPRTGALRRALVAAAAYGAGSCATLDCGARGGGWNAAGAGAECAGA
eukprot:gene13345-23440_t